MIRKFLVLSAALLLAAGCTPGDNPSVSVVASQKRFNTASTTAILPGPRSAFDISLGNDGKIAVTKIIDGTAVSLPSGTTVLQFDDYDLAIDPAGVEYKVYRLYQSALNRLPDRSGLGFWISAARNRVSLPELAAYFMMSPEFKGAFGEKLSDEEFVARIYVNVLGRPAEASGLAWWVERLTSGVSRADVLAAISESGENISRTASATQKGVIYERFTSVPGTSDFGVRPSFEVSTLTTQNAYRTAVGDFDGNGLKDLIVISAGVAGLTAPESHRYLQLSPGQFERSSLGERLGSFAQTADVNGDGIDDFLTGWSCALDVMLGSQLRQYEFITPRASFGCAVPGIKAGRFNGDSLVDFLTLDRNPYFGKGLGSGKFDSTPVTVPSTYLASTVDVADLDGDGSVELVGVNSFWGQNSYLISVLTFDGTQATKLRHFERQYDSQVTKSSATAGLLVDVNKDNILDLIILTGGKEFIQVLATAPGAFDGKSSVVRLDQFASTGSAADMNGDGNIDLVLSLYNGAAIVLGDGKGNWSSPLVPTGASDTYLGHSAVSLADMNNDGRMDIIFSLGRNIRIMLNEKK